MLGSRSEFGNRTFLNVFAGNIVQEWKKAPDKPNPDMKTRVNKNGDTRYYLEYPYVSGYLTGARMEETDFGDQIKITLVDGDDTYELGFPVESSYGRTFLMRMNNIDLSLMVKFVPYDFETTENGKTRRISGFNLFQEETKLDSCYTKDNPNGLPPLVERKKGSKIEYDGLDRLNFLYEQFQAFHDKVETIKASKQAEQPQIASTSGYDIPEIDGLPEYDDDDDAIDDLPF